ncbi:hypothetical protein PsorP6_006387 [Peronosclerospora sorghi]|uniref:Uncharacterized protein n=1 Tax=Peronosclerospora sorghi TaxID=230839 RepID=A0ACC0W4K8_9STRA|nr:hypothetical protein PsorP6_006387 [Peronosclerospora sorghi]
METGDYDGKEKIKHRKSAKKPTRKTTDPPGRKCRGRSRVPLIASNNADLAAAPKKSKGMNGFEFQRHLRAENKIEPLTSKVFDEVLAKFGDFSTKLKAAVTTHFKKKKLKRRRRQYKREFMQKSRDPTFDAFFEPEFKDVIKRVVPDVDATDDLVDVGYYLVVLEYAEGSTLLAAQLINHAMHRSEFKEVAKKMELGQFYLWNALKLTPSSAFTKIFQSQTSRNEWRTEVLKRYDLYALDLNIPITPELP